MRRIIALAGLAAVAILVAGCSGKTTGASDVTQTSARLNAQGSCDQNCSYHLRFARTVDVGWPDRSASLRPYTTPVRSGIGSTNGNTGRFGETATLLLPDTVYRYQACGRDAGYSKDVCVGPDGRSESSSTFTTQPGDYVFGSGTVSQGTLLLADFLVQATATSGGASPEGGAYGTGRSGGIGGSVTCLLVEGSRAVIGTPDTFFFIEDGPGDQPGSYDDAPTNGNAGTCPPVRSSNTTSGRVIDGITVHDSTP